MTRLSKRAKIYVLCMSVFGLGACGGGTHNGSEGGTSECPEGDEGCRCYPNRSCNSPTLSCLSMLCVSAGNGSGTGGVVTGNGGSATGPDPGVGGVVGAGGAPGSGGASVNPGTGGAQGLGGAPGSGGASITSGTGGAPGSGGAPGMGGAQGTGGAPGNGGAPGTGGATPAGGSSGGSASDGCNGAGASVIDNFASCDSSICNLSGRNGTWFSYSSNTNIGIQCSAQVPPVSWIDRSCGYYCTNGVAGATWAGAGFDLKDPSGAYDLSSYTGIYVKIETGQSLTVAIKDLAGGMWRSAALGGGSGAVTYTIPFSKLTPDSGTSGSLNLSQAVGLRFDVDPKSLASFGFAIHMVTLY
jgi:hypothetical protein